MKPADSYDVKTRRGERRFNQIKVCVFLSGLSIFSQLYIFQPMLPHLCKTFALNPAASSWAVSSATAGMALGLLFFSFKADSWPRKNLMSFSMLTSSVLTLVSAFIPWFWPLVAVSFVRGALLAGVSAVALTYLNEEVEDRSLGFAISLYLSGNAVGGMSGRIISAFLSGWLGWRATLAIVGLLTLAVGLCFWKLFPESRNFSPQKVLLKSKLCQMGQYMRTPVMLKAYSAAFLLMGCFVSVYNFTGFHLESPPYSLPHTLIACIFLMYTTGIAGSLTAGRISTDRRPELTIRYFVAGDVAGLLLMMCQHLLPLGLGLGVFTFSFFGTHALASRIVSQNAGEGRSTATSLYWLFYYFGSSVLGTGTGTVLSGFGWSCFIMLLIAINMLTLTWLWRMGKEKGHLKL